MKKVLGLALAVVSPALLFAQQKTLSLDQVVVTANKFDQKASQTGKVITVIPQKELQHSAGKTLGALLNEQPGITINGASETPGTNQTVYMRGADPKYTLIMINGIPVSDKSYINSEFDLNLIPLSSIERIEIMRGGYASLYGSGAAAGVINIITQKEGQRPFNATAGFSGGSYGTFREHAGINGRHKKIDYNLQIQNTDSRGFSSALDSTGHRGFDKDGFHRKSVYADLGIHPGAQWSIRPFLHFAYEKGDLDANAFTDDKDDDYTTSFFQTGLSIQHTFTNGDLDIKYSFNPTTRHYLNDSTDGSSYLKQKYQSYIHTADIYAHFRINHYLSFLVGNALQWEKTNQDDGFGDRLSGDSAQTDAMNVYGSLFLQTNNGFHLELGGRLNQHKTYGFHPVFSVNPSWLINDRIKIFANVASSYSAPSLYQLYSPYGNLKLEPETGLSYEGGVEALLPGDKIKLRLTTFDRDMKKVIAFQNLHYVNYDRQQDHGVEAELHYAVTKQLQLKAYYAYADGRVTTQNSRTGKDSTYHNLFKRPKNSAGISVGYQVTPSLYLSMNGKYTGARRDLAFIGGTSKIVDLKNYVLLNFYAQYVWKKKYKAFVSLNNVTDSHYVETTGYTAKRFNFDAGVEWSLF